MTRGWRCRRWQWLRIGNNYVTRNLIGAVVGVQPFGGERQSGTGPKAGAPRYLHRFGTERTTSTDTRRDQAVRHLQRRLNSR